MHKKDLGGFKADATYLLQNRSSKNGAEHAMHAAAKRYGVVTQVGHHGHSNAGIRLAAEYMAAGAFGEVREVWCWCDRVNSRLKRPPKASPPAGMDWDVWCDGSPICDRYDADELYPALTWHDWHNWIDYGNGAIGNMGSHILDTPVFMLGLDKTPPAPYDVDRDGLVIGDGATTFVLEELEHARTRGARILAELVGFAETTDGTHVTNPNAETMARDGRICGIIPRYSNLVVESLKAL